MQLDLDDVMRIFGVAEERVRDWIRDDAMPCDRIGGQYRFSRAELLEWLSDRGRPVPAGLVPASTSDRHPSLEEALRAGGIHAGLSGADKAAALRAVAGVLPLPPTVDRGWFLQMMFARESLGSTGIGDGIAIPHVRHPILMRVPRPLVTLCFLDRPVDFESIDGKPVHALFTLISPTAAAHLHLLARLGFAVGHEPFRKAVRLRRPAAEILAAAAEIDARCRAAPPPEPPKEFP